MPLNLVSCIQKNKGLCNWNVWSKLVETCNIADYYFIYETLNGIQEVESYCDKVLGFDYATAYATY